MPWLKASRRWLAGFMVAASSASALVILSEVAEAGTCGYDPPNVGNVVDQAGTTGRGNRANDPGMVVLNSVVECGRVSSLFVSENIFNNSFAEVGWYEDPSTGNWNYVCLVDSSGQPRELAYGVKNGIPACLQGGSATISPGQDPFSVADSNQDGRWSFGHNTSQIWISPQLGFTSGVLTTNGERRGTDDSAHAIFDGLDRLKPDDQWTPWGNPSLLVDDDSSYKDCIDSGNRIRVIAQGTPC